MRLDPARDRARHGQGGRDDPAQRDFVQAALLQHNDRGGGRRLAAAAQIFDLAAAAFVDQPERIAPEAGHVRIDHREHSGGRDRRIDRGPASAEHVNAG